MTPLVAGHRERGFTFTELLVGLAITASVIAGALHTWQASLHNLKAAHAAAELEDRLTFAMRGIVADARLAGYGLHRTPPPGTTPAMANCRGRNATPWALTNTPVAVDAGAGLPCPPAGAMQPGSHALHIRHLDPLRSAPVRQSHAWYVGTRSSEPERPALRRQTLQPDGSVHDEEIMPGVGQLSVRLAIDTDDDGRMDQLVAGAAAVVGRPMALSIRLTVAAHDPTGRPASVAKTQLTAERLVFLRNAVRD